MKETSGGLNKLFIVLMLFMMVGCSPKAPRTASPADWCKNMCESEDLGLVEYKDGNYTFLSYRKVGIGEARRLIVRMVRSLEKEGLRPSIIRIMFKEPDKRKTYRYVKGFIAEVVYSDDQIFYGMMGGVMQQVQREDYGDAVGRAIGYPAPIDPVVPPPEETKESEEE